MVLVAVVLLGAVAVAGVVLLGDEDGDEEAYCDTLDTEAFEDVAVIVFFSPEAADTIDVDGIVDELEALGATAIEYVDRAEAFAEAEELFADQPTMTGVLRPEDVPTSFRLRVPDLDAAQAVREAMRLRGPDVLDVEDSFEFDGRVIDLLELAAIEGRGQFFEDRPVDAIALESLSSDAPSEIADDARLAAGALEDQAEADDAGRAASERVIADAADRCRLRPDNE